MAAISSFNTISVDVEDYYHATNIERIVPPSKWHSLESRVEHSTHKILELFSKFNTKATFFVLGHVAKQHPQLVKEIVWERVGNLRLPVVKKLQQPTSYCNFDFFINILRLIYK